MEIIKVLLVDKSEIFLEGLVNVLQHESNIKVVGICHTGLEANRSACKHQPDVVMMDTELSECCGIDIIQLIHTRLPTVNIIVLTSSETDADFICCIKAGARAYISKSCSTANLIRAINLIANGGVVISPPMAARMLEEFTLLEKYKETAKLEGCDTLSEREQTVLSLVAQGFPNKSIATTLFISEQTVKVHMRNIMVKLHAHNRQQAVILARANDRITQVT